MVPPKYLKDPVKNLQDALRQSGVITTHTFTKAAAVIAGGASALLGASSADAQMLDRFPGNPWPMFKSSNETRVNTSNTQDARNSHFDYDPNGNFVVTWNSSPSSYSEVFFQRFDESGNKLGSEVRADDGSAGTFGDAIPRIAVDNDGDFMLVWESYGFDSNTLDVFGRIFNADGTPATGQFRVNDTTNFNQTDPRIGVDANGDFTVVWRGYDNGSSDYRIYGKRFNNDGSTDIAETTLSHTSITSFPAALSVDEDGDFILVYGGYNTATSSNDIFVRGFSNTWAQNIAPTVANGTTAGAQREPSIDRDSNDNFVVAWMDTSGADGYGRGIFAQRFSANGSKAGGEIQVNGFTYGDQESPNVAMDADGNFVIVYEGKYDEPNASNSSVLGQKFDAAGSPAGEEFRINIHAQDDQKTAFARFDRDGSFRVVYDSYDLGGNVYYDIATREFECSINPAQQGRQAKLTTTGEAPDIAFDEDGSHGAVAWDSYDYYGKYYYISVRRLDSNGQPTGSNIDLITGGQTNNAHINPVIAMDSDGDFVVVWQGYGVDSAGYGILGHRIDKDGNLVGSQFLVNTAQAGDQVQPRVAMNASGNFVVVWEDSNSNQFKAQRFNSSGVAQGGELTIGNSGGDDWTGVDMMDDGTFAVTWPEYSGGQTDIMVKRFSSTGTLLGSAFSPHTATPGEDEKTPDVALDNDGNLVVTWMDYTDGSSQYDVKAHLYDANNNPNGNVFTVNQRTEGDQGWPAVAFDDNGNFTIGFDTYYQQAKTSNTYFESDVHAVAFDKNGNALTHEFGVSSETYDFQENVRIAHASNGQMMLTWQSFYYDNGSYSDYSINVARFAMPIVPTTAPTWLTLNGATSTTMDSLVTADPNGDTEYEITALPSNASLSINGVNANVGDTFLGSDALVFTPGGGGVGNFSVNTTDKYTGHTGSTTVAIYTSAPAVDITAGSEANDYGLFSIPSNTQTTWDVLTNNFGAYDPFTWRAYGYDATATDPYKEGENIPSINSTAYLGRGVWIISRFSQDIVMSDNPAVTSDVTVTLNAGWNLIGNPFLANISKDQICVDTGNGYEPLNDQSIVQTTLYTWSRSIADYVTVNSLGTFEGAWIYSSSPGTLKFVAPGNL